MGRSSHIQRSDIPPGTLVLLILTILAREGSMHGFGIAQFLARTTGDVLQVEEGSLYPALQRMWVEGWVTAEWRQTENNRRARYYTLTPDGRKQLRAEASAFDKVMNAISLVLHPSS
jgi:PadR family transcriptional regulator PadR